MAEFNELVDKLKRDEPLLLHMMEIRYKHPDYQDEDVWTALGIGSSKYYTEKKRLAELRKEYIDICYWGGRNLPKKKGVPFFASAPFYCCAQARWTGSKNAPPMTVSSPLLRMTSVGNSYQQTCMILVTASSRAQATV